MVATGGSTVAYYMYQVYVFDQLIYMYQSQELKAINLVWHRLCRSSPGSAKKYSQVPSATNDLRELCRELFNAVKDCTVRDAPFPCFISKINCLLCHLVQGHTMWSCLGAE